MTLQQLFESATVNSSLLIYFLIMMPILAFIISLISGEDGDQSPWNYIFSTLVYMVCIPGIFAVVLCLYSLGFERQSLLQVNALIYFLPIVSMVATLWAISRKVDLAHIPGFGKIWGLVMVMVATYVIILLLQKMRIYTIFIGSIWHLLGLFVILFAVIKFGFDRLTRRSS